MINFEVGAQNTATIGFSLIMVNRIGLLRWEFPHFIWSCLAFFLWWFQQNAVNLGILLMSLIWLWALLRCNHTPLARSSNSNGAACAGRIIGLFDFLSRLHIDICIFETFFGVYSVFSCNPLLRNAAFICLILDQGFSEHLSLFTVLRLLRWLKTNI